MKRDFSSEFEFIASRSSGSGGQHVNKVSTKVELRFNVNESKILNEDEKLLIHKNLKNRINSEGILIIVSQETRSQLRNKKICIEKFYEIIENALIVPKKRKIKQKSRKYHLKRLENKKLHSEKKENRRKFRFDF